MSEPCDEVLLEVLAKRASVRTYEDRDIPEEVMDRILDVGAQAATGGNLQPYSVIVIRDPERRKALAEWCHQPFMAKAPVHLLVCYDVHRLARWARVCGAPFCMERSARHTWIGSYDTAIFAEHLCVAADAMGVGNVYVGTIVEYLEQCREAFELPDGVMPQMLICLGWPKNPRTVSRRLPLSLVAHREKYRLPEDAELAALYATKYENRTIPITPERLDGYRRCCTALYGAERTAAMVADVERAGRFNAAQLYFGLHYRADYMASGNVRLSAKLKALGFDFFADPPWPEPED